MSHFEDGPLDSLRDKITKSKMDRRAALKTGLLSSFTAGASFSPRVNAYVQPRKGLSGDEDGIQAFNPTSGDVGDPIVITGQGFGNQIENLLLIIQNNEDLAFVRPLSVVDHQIVAQILAVPPGMQPGLVTVALGSGVMGPMTLAPGLFPSGDIFSWVSTGGEEYQSEASFSFPWAANMDDCILSWSNLSSGSLEMGFSVPLNESGCAICPAGTQLTINFDGTASDNGRYDFRGSVVTTVDLYAQHLADAVCYLLATAMQERHGVILPCTSQQTGSNSASVTVSAPNGASFTAGAVNLALCHSVDSSDSTDSSDSSDSSESSDPDDSSDSSDPDDSTDPDDSSDSSDSSDSFNKRGGDCPSIDIDFLSF